MQWKKFAVENLAELFERPNKKEQQQRESKAMQGELLKTIGTQKIELDFLKKSIGNCTNASLLYCPYKWGAEREETMRTAGHQSKRILLQKQVKAR